MAHMYGESVASRSLCKVGLSIVRWIRKHGLNEFSFLHAGVNVAQAKARELGFIPLLLNCRITLLKENIRIYHN